MLLDDSCENVVCGVENLIPTWRLQSRGCHDAYCLHLDVVDAYIHESMIGVVGAPAVLHDEERLALAVVGQTHNLHAVVVGGEVILKLPLPLVLHIVAGIVVEGGHTALERESRLADVALPAHGMTVADVPDDDAHERVDGHVHERVGEPVVGHLEDERLSRRDDG